MKIIWSASSYAFVFIAVLELNRIEKHYSEVTYFQLTVDSQNIFHYISKVLFH